MKKSKSLFSRIITWIHLWPSIVSGIIVVFVCLTGTVIVYGDEIMDISAGDARYVSPGETRISSDDIQARLMEAYPDGVISEYVFFKEANRSIRLRVFNPKERKLTLIYMNPYTGEVLKEDSTIYFFFVTAHLHSELLAGGVGHWLVTISTIVFVISCITGLILWWPVKWTKKSRKDSFTIRWNAKFKRLNYDLHNVLGFYTLPISIILGTTGLIIFFQSFMGATIQLAGGSELGLREILPKMDTLQTPVDLVPLAYEVLENVYSESEMVSTWNADSRKMGAYVFTAGKVGLKSAENAEIAVFDRYTGLPLQIEDDVIRHEKVSNTVWQLHLGQWWGQFGKLLTFITGLVTTSLPITGFIYWWGRRKKGKKKTKKAAV